MRAMLKAKEEGLIRHIGISNHRLSVALEAAESGLYETIQFPFSYLATKDEIELVNIMQGEENRVYCHESTFWRPDYEFRCGIRFSCSI